MTSKLPTRLSVSHEQLAESGRTVGLGPMQTNAMWADLVTRAAAAPASGVFGAAQVAWYFGAAIVLAAMGLLVAIVSSNYGSGGLLSLAVVYAGLFTFGGWTLASQRDLRTPGGLLYALGTLMVPVAVATAGDVFKFNAGFNIGLVYSFGALFFVGLAVARATSISFVAFPALVGGWIAAGSYADSLSGAGIGWAGATALYGLATVAVSFLLDTKTDEDYSWWGYLVGATAAVVGLAWVSKGDAGYLAFACGGVVSLFVSVLLSRKVFAFAGAAAVLTWIGHYGSFFLSDSAVFPLVLTAVGVATIYGGVVYQRNSDRIEAAILRMVPEGLRAKLPRR